MSTERRRMQPFAELSPWQAAFRQAVEAVVPIARCRTLATAESLGRVLAEPAAAAVDVPNTDRAAMDGYAVRSRDCTGASSLRCVGRLAAGMAPQGRIDAGECLEIATGATLPAGADAVVPVERCGRRGVVAVRGEVRAGEHVVRRGQDLERGKVVVAAGARVTPARLAGLVAAGVERVRAWQRPRVLVVPTGDEIVPAGARLAPGQVYDSNAAFLRALLAEAGAVVEQRPALADEAAEVRAFLQECTADIVVTIGGTSVGRRDLIADVAATSGEVLVHGVAVKPGKPLLVARLQERLLIGLPGFPTTCMLLAYALLRPLVRRAAHLPPEPARREARLSEPLARAAGKTRLVPVALEGDTARPTFRGSAAISSLLDADGWLRLEPGDSPIAAGTSVEVSLF